MLRPGGHFLYADFRGYLEYDNWDAALAAIPMEMASKRDISAEVLRARDKNSEVFLDLNSRHIPKGLQFFGKMFAGAPGTLAYRQMQTGKASYRMYHFIKD